MWPLPLSAAMACGAPELRLCWNQLGALRSSDVWDPGAGSVPLTGLLCGLGMDWAPGLYKLPSDSNAQPSLKTTACCGLTYAGIVLMPVRVNYLVRDFYPVLLKVGS